MQGSDTSKVIAAFFLGIVIALGSAFVMFHPRDPKGTVPAATTAASVPAPALPAPAPAVPDVKAEADIPAAEPAPISPRPVRQAHGKRLSASTAQAHDPAPSAESASPTPSSLAQASPAQVTPADPKPSSVPVFTPSPAPPSAQPVAPHVVTLQSGTTLNVRLNQALTSEKNVTGDSFRATLTSPIIVDGFIIADRGSSVEGKLVQVDRSGRIKGRANLDLALTGINTTDGQHIRVHTDTLNREAVSGVRGDTAKVAGGAALGALIGGLAGGGKGAAIGAGAGGAAGTGVVLGTRGKEVSLQNETPLTFRLTSPVTITEQLRN